MPTPKPEYSQVNVFIPKQLLRDAWAYAASQGMKKHELVSAALAEYLATHQGSGSATNSVRLPEGGRNK